MTVLLALALLLGSPTSPVAARAATTERQPDVAGALAVLHRWDDQRERAWAAGDEAGLRALYVPGSRAGRSDVRMLRAYAARRLVVRRIETQVFAATVLTSTPRRLALRVLDRVAGGEVVGPLGTARLGASAPARRTVVLVLDATGWRVQRVSAWGSGPPSARR